MSILFLILIIGSIILGVLNIISISIAVVLAIVFLGVWFAFMYNSFITGRNRVKEAWADIDVQLKRRYDLIPNLINTVKGSANFESSTLEKVINARSKAMNAGTVAEHTEAENQLTGALKSIFALSESYPDLKSNQNFLSLQSELSDTENKIQAARRFYNSVVLGFNTMLETFPSNMFAKMFSFTSSEFFELKEDDVAKNNVKVEF